MLNTIGHPNRWSVLRRQLAVCTVFSVLLATIVGTLYWQERRREWTLRSEQAKHRLDVAFELISRELDRVRADALFLGDQEAVRKFVTGEERWRSKLQAEYKNFVRRKTTYDQIRLLNLDGRETIRVNYRAGGPISVPESQLQDKADRYYFREALALPAGEVFVSEFDLNLEHGQVERPLKPVIRFVTPVMGIHGQTQGLLVLNYLGAALLQEFEDATLPGFTFLLRPDGYYLRGREQQDDWGWLLGHNRTFPRQFTDEWARLDELSTCALTSKGAFATRRIMLGQTEDNTAKTTGPAAPRNSLILVAYLPRDQVFIASNELLRRLLLLAGCMLIPLAIFARVWAQATLGRAIQSRRIAESEERLRKLSSRLLRIQEEERRAISREIHDELGQQVTAISLDLKLAERNFDTGQARPHLERAIHENDQLLQTLHAFATRVRPAVLDDLGLHDAVESHLWEFQERTSIPVDACLAFQAAEIPNEIADNAYRLLQESLNNVAKHADASKVAVRMATEQRGADRCFHISIRDDGCGFSESEIDGARLGLVGMQERVELLGGEIAMVSNIDHGTSVEISLPLPERSWQSDEECDEAKSH